MDKIFDLDHLLKMGGRVERETELSMHRFNVTVGDVVIGYSLRIDFGFNIKVIVTSNKYTYHECTLTAPIKKFFKKLGDLAFKANEQKCELARIAASKVFEIGGE